LPKILTDNGKEFTDRFCATGKRTPTGSHPFDRVCSQHHIEHRLITPRHPRTNGMIERFNGRISEILATTRFDSSKNLEQTLTHYVRIYNHSIPQRALGHITPIQALQNWRRKQPEIFSKRVYNHSGLDTYASSALLPVHLQGSIPSPWLAVTGAGFSPARICSIAQPQPRPDPVLLDPVLKKNGGSNPASD
jgi:hypothetical protein